MPMLLIEGVYRIVGAGPDGDSIKFYPHNRRDWELVRGARSVHTNSRGGAQLRLDALDTLETHYSPAGGTLGMLHQPFDLGRGAAERLLTFLDFRDVVRGRNEIVSSARPDQVEGYIFTRFADTYGRCVSFMFKGKHRKQSGTWMHVGPEDIHKSGNYQLLAEGWGYPTYYSKLYPDLRKELTAAVNRARDAKQGIWGKDLSISGLAVETVEGLSDTAYVMPKLYRRLVDYFALNNNDSSLDGFKQYLADRDDRLLILSDGHFTGFDYVVEVAGQTVKMTTGPDNLVFQEK